MKEGVGQEILESLESARDRYKDNDYPAIPDKEITNMLEQVVDNVTEGKPYEGLTERLSKKYPGGLTDIMSGILSGIENIYQQDINVPGIPYPDKMFVTPQKEDELLKTVDGDIELRLRQELVKLSRIQANLTAQMRDSNDLITSNTYSLIQERKRQIEDLLTSKTYTKGANRQFLGTKNSVRNRIEGQYKSYEFRPEFIDETIPDKYFQIPAEAPNAWMDGTQAFQKAIIDKLIKEGYFVNYTDQDPNNWYSKFGVKGTNAVGNVGAYKD
tara:strand:- start:551 stop:1363 length:813 start_codon:yes stop_codon:yes gene_type:complete